MQGLPQSDTTPEYLTTKELAELLRIKERKVYDLAAAGEVPCAKVTGKLLFPSRDVHAWLAESRIGPTSAYALPDVFLGSHDPLLDWSLRESRCGLATYFDGSMDGLDRFSTHKGIATGLHVYSPATQSWNLDAVQQRCHDMDAVLIGFAVRQRGLVSAANVTLSDLHDLVGRTVVQRQAESGAEPLLAFLMTEADVDTAKVKRTPPVRSEADAALAILRGDADAAFGLEAFARQYKLGFTPLIEERFDLLIHRRAYFEPAIQTFLAFCRSRDFINHAATLTGYDLSEAGRVRWNA